MDLAALKAELLAGHPDTGAYSADNEVAAAQLNTENRQINRVRMTATEVINAIDKTEFNGLLAADKQTIWNVLHIGDINPFGIEADLFVDAFGGGSTTVSTLLTLRRKTASRAVELGLGRVGAGDVEDARNLP